MEQLNPATYSDNRNLTRCSIEVARAVFDKLPEYKVTYLWFPTFWDCWFGQCSHYQMGAMILVGQKNVRKNI